MSGFVELFMMAQEQDGTAGSGAVSNKWGAIMEATFMIFLVTLLPKMMTMDPDAMTWQCFWEPVLSALLAGCYTYIRARGLVIGEGHDRRTE